MSFSREVKEELSKLNNLANKKEVEYEFLGYIESDNTVEENKLIKFSTENDYNIDRFAKITRNVGIEDFDINVNGKIFFIEIKKIKLEKKIKLDCRNLETSIFEIIEQCEDTQMKKAFVRGIFLGSGSINNPEKKYHLEFGLKNKKMQEKVVEIMNGYGINLKQRENIVYIKEGEEISKFLAFVGAVKSVLKFEEIRVQRYMNNKVNRLVNCETANLNKVLNASVEQIDAIRKLKESGRFEKLDDNLKEIAELRIQNPEMPLQELGKMLKSPIGKSGVNYRLKKIIEMRKKCIENERTIYMKKMGVYIHIPFCKQKCYYCDFISFENKENICERYINCLKKEIKEFNKSNQYEISTIYIGGGTPSFIDSRYIKEILSLFSFDTHTEITIEINPGTATVQKLKEYKEIGINRLSIGLQSTDDKLLKQIGRIHSYREFLNTYELARNVGFNNINVDLMIGLPNQNIANIKKSLEEVVKLLPEHISVYSLIVEENTKLEKMIQNKQVTLPNEEQERNMYWYVKDFLELQGYKHYEISNFSKKGNESKHNLDCWEQKEYIGLGLNAHSYVDNIRFSNTENLEQYIKNCEEGNFEKNRIIQEKQDKFMQEKEYMLIGLRKIDGVSINAFKNKFGENPIFIFREELDKLVKEELLQINLDNIKLTNKGLDLANIVWEEFV